MALSPSYQSKENERAEKREREEAAAARKTAEQPALFEFYYRC